MKRFQRGVTTVEFAIVGVLLMVVLFAVIEFGRALYVANTLSEGTRRGVRVAVVCPVNDVAAKRAAVFAAGGGTESALISGLSTDNVMIEYLDASGGVVGDPAGAGFDSIRYVRARIANFNLDLAIPMVLPTIQMNGFDATLPRESLGVPRTGVVEPC